MERTAAGDGSLRDSALERLSGGRFVLAAPLRAQEPHYSRTFTALFPRGRSAAAAAAAAAARELKEAAAFPPRLPPLSALAAA